MKDHSVASFADVVIQDLRDENRRLRVALQNVCKLDHWPTVAGNQQFHDAIDAGIRLLEEDRS